MRRPQNLTSLSKFTNFSNFYQLRNFDFSSNLCYTNIVERGNSALCLRQSHDSVYDKSRRTLTNQVSKGFTSSGRNQSSLTESKPSAAKRCCNSCASVAYVLTGVIRWTWCDGLAPFFCSGSSVFAHYLVGMAAVCPCCLRLAIISWSTAVNFEGRPPLHPSW